MLKSLSLPIDLPSFSNKNNKPNLRRKGKDLEVKKYSR